jgi:phosphonate transport system ATP-binding protein
VNSVTPIDLTRCQPFDAAQTDVITVRNLCKSFNTRTVLDDVSFSIPRGKFVVLLGPSGGGKSTLFRCLTRLMEPDSGHISINNTTITSLNAGALNEFRRQVGFIFQQFNLVKRLSALDNVLAARLGYTSILRAMLRRFSESDRQLALACLDSVGLLDQAYQKAQTLSGGQQQRVAIARAFAQQGELILADEPISSLDPESSENILQILQRAARDCGFSVLCSLHQVELAVRYADRIVALKHGRIFFDGPSDDFKASVREELYSAVKA